MAVILGAGALIAFESSNPTVLDTLSDAHAPCTPVKTALRRGQGIRPFEVVAPPIVQSVAGAVAGRTAGFEFTGDGSQVLAV